MMRIDSQSLDTAVEKHFDQLKRRVAGRLEGKPSLDWYIDQDLFRADKQIQNTACLDLARQIDWANLPADNRLRMLVYLCCRSNWIDSLEDKVDEALQQFVGSTHSWLSDRESRHNRSIDSAFFQVQPFVRTLKTAGESILYETDNCGEVVFDLCLIRELLARGLTVYLCPKQCPLANDATVEDVLGLLETDFFADLKSALLQHRLRTVTTGPFVGGGKLPHDINPAYRDAFIAARAVIVKGQGNFQSMPIAIQEKGRWQRYHYRKPIIFITGIKADLIQMCLTLLFPRKSRPPANSMFLYVHDGSVRTV